MANSDKNIRITTNNSTTSLPKIAFTGQNNSPITLYVLDDNTLSFEGSAGQLFSINNVLSTGYIFAINDISGIPSLRINADGTVGIAEFTGNVGIGLTNPTFKFQTNGSAGFGASIWSSPSFSSSISGVTFNNGAITSTGVISSTGRVSIQISDTAALAVKNAGGTSILNVDTTNGITSVLSSTGSTSTTTGALVITGGVGIGGTLFTSPSYASSISGVILNNGAITASLTGFASTASNIRVVGSGNSNLSHAVLFSPVSSSSGSAVSSDATFFFNPFTEILSISGLAVTSNTASTSTTTGALTARGGVGIGGSVNIGGSVTVTDSAKLNSSLFNLPPTSSIGASLIQSGYGAFGSYWTGYQVENGYLIFGRQTVGGSIIIAELSSGVQVGGTGNVFAEALQHFKWGKDKYVVLASTGNSVLYSPSPVGAGSSWYFATLPATASWQKLEYGNNRFVAIATGSTAAYSYDGITWSLASLPVSTAWSDVRYGNGVFVAGAASTVAYSYDGIEWTIASNNVAASNLTYGNGLFFANGGGNTASYSSDGISWTNVTLPSDTHRGSTYGNGVFYNLGNGTNSYFSSDITNWITGPGGSEGVTAQTPWYANNTFIFKLSDGYSKTVSGPSGTLDFNPRFTGEINNVRIGAIKPGAAEFTTLAASGPVRFVSNLQSTSAKTGSLVVSGGVGIGGSVNIGGRVGIGTVPNLSMLNIQTSSAGTTGLSIIASSSQSAPLLEWWSYGGIIGLNQSGRIKPTGELYLGNQTVANLSSGTNPLFSLQGRGATEGMLIKGFNSGASEVIFEVQGNTSAQLFGIYGDGGVNAPRINVTNSTGSTSTSSGALVVTGGVGIGDSLYVNGRVDASNFKAWVENRTLSSVDTCVGIGTFFINNGAHNILISLNVSDGGYSAAKIYTLTSNYNIGGWSIVAPLSSTGGYNNNPAINFQLEAYQGFNSLTLRARSLGTGGNLKIYVQNVGQNTATFTAYNTATSETAISLYHPYAFASQENNVFKINSSTGSTSTSSGALIVTGGVGIGGSLNVSSASLISGVTLNTGAITGTLSGYATTSNNIRITGAGNFNSNHLLTFTPSSSTSGSAISSDSTLSFNPSTEILSVSGLAITATTVSNSTAAGALQVAGGVGISGRLSFNQAAFGTTGIATNPTMAMIGSTGDPIYMSVLEDNSISFEGSQGQLFSITPNLSTGYIYSVNDITGIPLLRANANANVTANEYAGNFGIGLTNPGYKLHVVGSVGFTSTTASTSTTTGTLVVSGGVGIGGSLYVNSPSNISNVIINNGVITGNLTGTATTSGFATTASYSHQAGYAITAGSATTAITAVSTTSVSVASAGNSNLAHPILITNNPSSGSAVSSDNTFTFNPFTEVLSVSGIAVTSSTGSSNTTTGALVVTGGVGIGGSLNVGNKTRFNDDVYISSNSSNSLYSAGHGGVAGNWSVSSILSSGKHLLGSDLGLYPVGGNQSVIQAVWGLQLIGNSGVLPANFTPTSYGSAGAISVLVPNQQANRVAFGIIAHASQTGDLQIWTSSTASTSSPYLAVKADGQIYSYANIPATSFSSGALVVSGGVGIGGSLFVNGDLTINGTTTTINSVTLSVDDKNIELGSVGSPSDVTAEGGGITLKGATDKFINWYSGVGWSSSESWNLVSGSTFKINNTNVLSSTTLGTGVTNSSLTSVGTITSGTWAGTTITAHYGGTGLTTPFTVGDLVYANSSTTWARLPASSNSGYVLASAGSGATPVYTSASTITAGSATTAFNINVVLARSNANHSLLFSPSLGTASGAAVSNDGTLVFNPSTEILTVSGLAVTSSAATTSPSSGALTVSGGVGIGGTVNIQGDETVFGRLNYTQSTVGIAGTTVIPSISFIGQNNNPISLSVLADNTLSFEGSSGQLFSINNNLSSGTIFSVNDISGIPILRANANGTLSLGEFSGSVGVGLSLPSYKFHVNGSSGFGGTVFISGNTFIASSTTSTSTSTGALVVSGGVGIGGSLYVASPSNISNVSLNNGVITGNLTGTATTATYAHQSGYATTSGFATSATSASIATTSYSVNVNSASANANHFLIFSPNATGSGVALSTESALVYNPSTDILSVSGLAITSGTSSTTTSTGALIVSGGVGVSGTLNTNRIKAISKITFEPGTGTSAVSGWTGFGMTSVSKLIFGGNRFVGVGGSFACYSDDGVNFSYTTITGSSSSANYSDVAYGNGIFVAVNLEDVPFIAYSYDGAAWGTTSIPRGIIRTVGFGNGKFLAFSEAPGSIYSSTDGRNWSTIGSLGEFGREVYFANGYFLSPRGVSLYYSADGISWKTANTPGSNYIFNITYGKGLYIAADYLSSQYFTSTDLVTWTPRSIAYKVWTGASYVNGVFYLIPNNDYSLYHSLDGINWSTTSFSTPIGGTNKMFTANDRLYFFSGWGSSLWSTEATTGTLMAKPFYNGEIENTRIGAVKPDSATFTNLTALNPVTFTSTTPSTASDNGALVVFGGVGIGGTLSLAGRMNISSSFASTSTSTGALIVSGGVGIGGSLHTSTSVTSSISGLRILNGSLSSATSTIAATNKFQISVSDTAAFTVKNGGGTNVLNIDTTNGVSTISSSTGSTNTSTGALIVTGSVGVGGTVNANSVVTYNKLQNQSFSGSAVGATDGRSINAGVLSGHGIITYGNGVFVTNSSWGAYNAAYSTDGISWTASSLPVNQGYPVSMYGNGYFVLVASGATNVMYSPNGQSWSQVSIGNTFNRTDGAYGNGKYVVVGNGQTYNYSSNLTTWTSGTLPLTGDWRIAYGNGTFVALGYGTRQIIYSYDGIYWNIANTKVQYALNWTGLKYANGRFIASVYSGGGSAYSLDGINWYSAIGTGGENLDKISYGNGVYFVSSTGSYYTSGDGTTYNNSTPWSVTYEAGNTAYGLGKFQAIGRWIDGPTNTVTIEPKFTGEINNVRIGAITPASGDFTNLSSTGSANLVGTVNAYDLNIVSKLNQTPVSGGFAGSTGWTSAGLLSGAANYGLAFGNGLFVSIRKTTNSTSFSPDGRQWVTSAMPFIGNWMSIAWGVDKFVAVASAGTTGAYSGNGISWTSMSMPATAQGWYAVTYGDDKFVAVGNTSTAAYSSDGISWTGSSIANTNWTGIAYGNGTFIAVAGYGASAAYSYDGIIWNLVNLPSSAGGIKFITYGNGYFIVTNYVSNDINYSRDGINWSTSVRTSTYGIKTDIAYGNGIYSIFNYQEGTYSYDGVNWLLGNTIAATDWQAVAYGNNRFVATSINTSQVGSIDGPSNTLNLHPKFTGDIDNVRIGAKQPAAAEFTNLAAQQPVRFTANTTSLNTNTGALVVVGGVGIGGSLNTSTSFTSSISGLNILNGSLSSSTGTIAATNKLRISVSDTSAFLVADGGNSAKLSVDTVAGIVTVSSSIASTSTTTGALVVTGGVGIGGGLYVKPSSLSTKGLVVQANASQTGNLLEFQSSTGSTNTYFTSDGRLRISGVVNHADGSNPKIFVYHDNSAGGGILVKGANTDNFAAIEVQNNPGATVRIFPSGLVEAIKYTGYQFVLNATGYPGSSEFIMFNSPAGLMQFDPGATVALQRNFNIQGHEIRFSGTASTISKAVVVQLSGANYASTNCTITENIVFRVLTNITTAKGIVVQAATSQTANLFELQNSSSSTITSFNAAGELNISSSTASTSSTTGALIVTGGVGIGQTLFTSASHASSVSGVILNNGTITGTLSGYATTSNNIRVVGAGNSNLAHPVLFTPSSSSSGSAVSSDNTFFFNSFTEILSVSGLAVTASTASTSSTTGALIVTGGVGVGGTITVGFGVSTPVLSAPNNLIIKPGVDSSNAIQFTRSSTAIPVVTFDTLNSRVGIGVTNPEYDLEVNGEISATTKSFLIPHPTKENMKLRYGSLEGPENGVYLRGELKDSNEIILPDYWEKLVDHSTITVHLTPIGNKTVFVKEIKSNKIIIGSRLFQKIHCFYSIWAERKDVPKLKVEF